MVLWWFCYLAMLLFFPTVNSEAIVTFEEHDDDLCGNVESAVQMITAAAA